MTPPSPDHVVVGLAILGLVGIEAAALVVGIDGQLFSLVVATIGGLAGYTVHGMTRKD